MVLGIIDVHLYPYGNAKEIPNADGTYTYQCQHGDEECIGNFREACIIYSTGFNTTQYFPVIECMEASGDPVSYGRKCLQKFAPQIKWSSIRKCAEVSVEKTSFYMLRKFNLCRVQWVKNSCINWLPKQPI